MKVQTCLLLLVFALTSAAIGQDAPAVAEDVCNADFAKTLVDQQVAESRSVAETDKRVNILTRSGDFLWKFDEPRSREYFAEAYKVATDRFKEKGFENTKLGSGIYTQLPDYRFVVIRAIAKHDGAWGRRLSEELLKEAEKNNKDREPMDQDREVDSLMLIARDNIKTNPSLSWYLYRRLMRVDVDYQWFFQLFGVFGNDPVFADTLYGELLASHANATPRQVIYLSAYPFGRDRMFGYAGFSSSANLPENFSARPQLQARFIDLMIRRSDAFFSDQANYTNQTESKWLPSDAAYTMTALQELQPIVMQSFPMFLPRLNVALSKAMAMLSNDDRKKISDAEGRKSGFNRSFEDRIAELEKADEEGKLTDAMILKALIPGMKTEEEFKQFEPWLDKMTESEGRMGSINYFWFIRAKLAIKEGRFADAQKYAAKVPEVEHQAILWFDIAESQLKDANDAVNAYQTLRDVGAVARRAEDSVGKAKVLLGLANLYEKLNHSFAISELSDAVKVINNLKDADLQANWISRNITVKDMGFSAGFNAPGYDLEATFTTVSKEDFSLPLSNAKAMDDKFYRTIAVIAIAKNCIDRAKPKRPGK